MAENSTIEWTDHTFNPWEGCTKVSPGCANCYAEARNHRYGLDNWGKGKPRRRTSEANWRKPLQWNKTVICNDCGTINGHDESCPIYGGKSLSVRRPRVFCASLADWLDDEIPIEWLADLLKLIHDTPNLDWLLLTKRPENWRERIEAAGSLIMDLPEATHLDTRENALWWFVESWKTGEQPPQNVWIGATVEDQQRADERIPALLKIQAKVRFLSMEPLLGAVDLKFPSATVANQKFPEGFETWSESRREEWFKSTARAIYISQCNLVDWVIVGGESGHGPNIRPMHPDWARSIRDQCQAAGVPFFFKQWGEWLPCFVVDDESFSGGRRIDVPDLGSLAAVLREPSVKAFTPGAWRPLRRGDVTGHGEMLDDGTFAARVGKKKAGRLLDGREWNQFPEVA